MPFLTRDRYVATAGQREFDCSFPFLDASHVKVMVSGSPAPFEWITGSRIRLIYPAGAGSVVQLRRETPLDRALVTFQNGAVLTQEELNTAVRQTLFVQQELADLYNGALTEAQVRLGSNLGIVTDPQSVMDELTQLALENQVLEHFQNAIVDIELNAEEILRVALDTSQRDAAIEHAESIKAALEAQTASALAAAELVQANLAARATALRTDVDALTGVVDGLVNFGDGRGIATVIQQESTQRIDGDTALASVLSLIGAKSGDGLAFILNLDSVKASPTETMAQRLTALSAEDANQRALILSEQTARVNAAGAEAIRVDALVATTRTQVNAYTDASIITERTARTTAFSAEAARVDALVAQRLVDGKAYSDAKIVTEQNARVAGDTAEATARGLLTARVATAEGSIVSEQSARVAGDNVLTTTLALIGAKNAAGTAFIVDLNKAYVSATESLASRFASLSAATAAADARVTTEATARIAGDNAEATARGLLLARIGTAESSIVTEQSARVAGDNVLTTTLALIGAQNAGGTAFIIDTNKAFVSPTESLASRFTSLSAATANALAVANSEITNRTTADTALSGRIDTVGTRVTTVEGDTSSLKTRMTTAEAGIVNEQNARSTAVAAEATSRGQLAARVATTETDISGVKNRLTTAESAIQTEQTVRASAITAEASARLTLESKVNTRVRTFWQAAIPTADNVGDLWFSSTEGNKLRRWGGGGWDTVADTNDAAALTGFQSALTQEANTRAAADSALTTTLSLLGAMNAGNTAFILDMSKVRVDGSTSLGTRLSGMDTRMGNSEAAIVSEQTARSNGDSALATSITNVSAAVNGQASTITSLQTVTAGLQAKYSVALNVNGHITGWTANNDGTTGSFSILADRFAIVDPNGGSPIVVFEVSGGVVRAPSLVVGNLYANTVTTNHIVYGGVTTNNVAGGAISGVTSAYTAAMLGYDATVSTDFAVQSAARTFGNDSKALITFGAYLNVSNGSRMGAAGGRLALYRNGTEVRRWALPNCWGSAPVQILMPFTFTYVDETPGTGGVTYEMRMILFYAPNKATEVTTGFISERSLVIQEFKR